VATAARAVGSFREQRHDRRQRDLKRCELARAQAPGLFNMYHYTLTSSSAVKTVTHRSARHDVAMAPAGSGRRLVVFSKHFEFDAKRMDGSNSFDSR
jgi:hypothetical protein